MKKTFIFLIVLTALTGLGFTSCKKQSVTQPEKAKVLTKAGNLNGDPKLLHVSTVPYGGYHSSVITHWDVGDAGVIYVIDQKKGKMELKSIVSGVATNIYSLPGTTLSVEGFVVGQDGNIYLIERNQDTVALKKITPGGQSSVIGYLSLDKAESELYKYGHVFFSVSKDGTVYYHNDLISSQIFTCSPAGEIAVFAGSSTAGYADGTKEQAKFERLRRLIIADDGSLYAFELGDETTIGRVRRIGTDGLVSTYYTFPSSLVQVFDFALSDEGTLFASGGRTGTDGIHIFRINPPGSPLIIAGRKIPASYATDGPALEASFGVNRIETANDEIYFSFGCFKKLYKKE